MNKLAKEMTIREYYNLGSKAALEKLSSPTLLRRLLSPTQSNMLTGSMLGYGGLESLAVGNMVHNANKDLSKLISALKSKK